MLTFLTVTFSTLTLLATPASTPILFAALPPIVTPSNTTFEILPLFQTSNNPTLAYSSTSVD